METPFSNTYTTPVSDPGRLRPPERVVVPELGLKQTTPFRAVGRFAEVTVFAVRVLLPLQAAETEFPLASVPPFGRGPVRSVGIGGLETGTFVVIGVGE